jgi:hypothetical protein
MTTARFPIYWNFDGTKQGTVSINRQAGTFTVRAHRRHKAYELPLAFVAEIVAVRCIKAEVLRKRLEKARQKKEKSEFRRRNR